MKFYEEIDKISSWNMIFSLFNILMIIGITEKSIILTHTVYCCYCYKYTRATYDWFCVPGSHLILDTSIKKDRKSLALFNTVAVIK